VAVVTGGARRLGRRLCKTLAARGFDLVVLYRRSAAEANALARELAQTGQRARALAVDVGIEPRVAEAFDDIASNEGRVDLLVNNVGNYVPKTLRDLTPEDWDDCLQANLHGAFYCCYHARPMLEERKGQIINIGYAGVEGLVANTEATAYQVSKAGLLILTKSLAKELGPHSVRANMISPGQLENSVDLPGNLKDSIPIGRAGTLADITRALRYLLQAEYVTGVNIDVAGGYRL
jgi:NAD(P)-dependent dehydrogenase (short-subunit alcohol dehydrogenase family)